MQLNASVSTLKNVGPQRLAALNIIGIHTVNDIINHYPRDYQDRSRITAVSEVRAMETNTVTAVVTNPAKNLNENGKPITMLTLSDGIGELDVVWYGRLYMKTAFKKNDSLTLTGRVIWRRGRLRMISPDYEKHDESKKKDSLSFGCIIPIYPSTANISQKLLRRFIREALDKGAPHITEVLPEYILCKYNLCGKLYAVNNIHFPETDQAFFSARKRIVFEELLIMQTALYRLKGFIKRRSAHVIDQADVSPFISSLPFKLTNAQSAVLDEILADMQSGFVMNRLVQGDVGSGKTVVALAAAYAAVMCGEGGQAAIMAPTEVLALQHYEGAAKLLTPLGINVCILTGSMTARQKRKMREGIEKGEYGIIIGTHSLIQRATTFHSLKLVITDEQHRFGVRQRAELSNKGTIPHVLVMSATPIPRTLGLILYGDMDISIINEKPPGRQPVATYTVDSSYRTRLFNFIAKEIGKGRQAFIVCTQIEPSKTGTIQAVNTYVLLVRNALFGIRVECLHGKMKPQAKEDILRRFTNKEIDVLVSTTVIEVGVDVPNASVMVIENAERFGLSQLHQLRGRVGRGNEKAYCVLVTDSESDVCEERMKAMTETNDGFVLSERDLALRGPGDFFGVRQHGLPELRASNLYMDLDILKLAQQAAQQIIDDDPLLDKPENHLFAESTSTFLDYCENIATI